MNLETKDLLSPEFYRRCDNRSRHVGQLTLSDYGIRYVGIDANWTRIEEDEPKAYIRPSHLESALK